MRRHKLGVLNMPTGTYFTGTCIGALLVLVAPLSAGEAKIAGSTTLPYRFADGSTVGTWSGGALLSIENEETSAPVFRAVDREGKDIQKITFTVPGADVLRVIGTRAADGTLAVAGTAFSNTVQPAGILGIVSADGKSQTVVRTYPFWPTVVTIAADGSIWITGREAADSQESEDYPVIRRYDRSGALIGSYLKKSVIQAAGERQTGHPINSAYLIASGDRVGWFSDTAKTYIEFALDGTELGRYTTPAERAHIASICPNNAVFASVAVAGRSPRFTMMALDRATGKWSPLPDVDSGYILGCEDNTLAIGKRTKTSESITWVAP